MVKIKSILLIICILVLIPNFAHATNVNMLEEQYRQEANKILSVIEEQKKDTQMNNKFIVALISIVIISMIFENFVKYFKYDIKEKNENEEETIDIRKKLWITYGIHFLGLFIIFIVCKYIVKFSDMYTYVLLIISICNVEIGPFLQIRMGKNKKEKES